MKKYKGYFTVTLEGECNIIVPSREDAEKSLDSYLHNEFMQETIKDIENTGADITISSAFREIKEKKK